MALQALIFDVDGTLADTERDGHRVAFNLAFAQAGLAWHWGEALYGELLAVTGGKERIKHYVALHQPDMPEVGDFDEFVKGLHAAKTRHYTELLAKGSIPLRPGVRRLLDEARAAGLRLAIATTTTPANISALLTHAMDASAESWFEVIAAGDIVPAKKPAPDIYTYVLKRLGLPPSECMAFEDSENGIRSSLGADVPTIVTTNGYTRDHNFNGALVVLDQMGEPGQPLKVLAGASVNGAEYLSLDLVRSLHAS
ncbi:MAG: HAD family hydrolase [Gammaproteobacteria bacterium]|nr:MAG: HAD family hydrolase [Gammaproteobacteria bacterium]